MNDFRQALHRGLQAADEAKVARAEINAIFNELNLALLSVTQDRVEIARTDNAGRRDPGEGAGSPGATAPSVSDLTAISVTGNGTTPAAARRIAKWRQATDGYPCTIIWEDRHVECDSAESLRQELMDLVASSSAGEAIKAIMMLK
ncbi:hypothetical protein CDN99_02945 [Roseateles aquatilis]|uniref:Uncharacterized protein n=1 Tax=Roseateles aquatilis TaxID=431061 RepID=A0A246JLI8_9BURK|nr:hypothetical protein [Roseateles aquatilis]OWQ93445.1 hypothetical protein CDN99_02945 [Roseateles aquatilis]